KNNLALAYYYIGQFQSCLHMIDEVLEKDPGNLHALCNLAIVYKHSNQQNQLDQLLLLLKKTYPLHPEHMFKLAMTLGIMGEHADAYKHFRRLLKSVDYCDDPCLYHYTAVAAFNSSRLEEAKRLWQLAERYD